MDEVVFHEHLEKGHPPDTSDCFVQQVPVPLEIRDRLPFDKRLHQNRGNRNFLNGLWEVHIFVQHEQLVECF